VSHARGAAGIRGFARPLAVAGARPIR
jgi:hypothetical protein